MMIKNFTKKDLEKEIIEQGEDIASIFKDVEDLKTDLIKSRIDKNLNKIQISELKNSVTKLEEKEREREKIENTNFYISCGIVAILFILALVKLIF